MKKKLFTVYIDDHTHLGGPMGTEYTTSIEVKNFLEEIAAWEFAWEYANKNGNMAYAYLCPEEGVDEEKPVPTITKEKFMELSFKKKNEVLGDLGNIGITIQKTEVY